MCRNNSRRTMSSTTPVSLPGGLNAKSAALPAPLFNWLDERAAGVLVHPTSLPSPNGIGAFDESVDALLEFLAQAGMRYWQVCPLGPTGFGDSPYQCFSSFAGNPYLADLTGLVRAGLLTDSALGSLGSLNPERVDFGALYERKWPLLFAAHETWRRDSKRPLPYGDFAAFRQKNASWLRPYALFSALKEHFQGR